MKAAGGGGTVDRGVPSSAPGPRVVHGSCPEALASLPDASVDSCVTDPPYELGFMGKRWDASGIAYSVDLWREVLRVLKPGGHLLAFGGTRTYHRMAVAIEDAGFEIRDSIHWVYGSGFPKSLDVSKAIDAHLGAERQPTGEVKTRHGGGARSDKVHQLNPDWTETPVTAPGTPEAARWSGWGTALKPSHEPVVVARKPLAGTVAANVLAHGTGGINVEACRVGWASEGDREGGRPASLPKARLGLDAFSMRDRSGEDPAAAQSPAGRWPPNLILTHHPECHGSCAPGCPVAELDRQSGESTDSAHVRGRPGDAVFSGVLRDNGVNRIEKYGGFNDSGGASRFFPVFRYVPKPSRAERDAGCWDLEPASGGDATDREDGSAGLKSPRAGAGRNGGARNVHPTVKPIELMEWLCRLVTPPGGVVLDPFTGSGTTGCAAVRCGFGFLGVEREAEYVAIAERRIALAAAAPKARGLGELERAESDARQIGLFG